MKTEKQYRDPICSCCSKNKLRLLSDICLYAGFVSIIASIATWFTATKGEKGHTEQKAYSERFGIFIGLWVPSFFILSNRLSRKADEIPETTEEK